MSDLIDRQAAIDAMLGDKVQITNVIRAIGNERDFEVLNCTCDRHAEIIKALPTVQPKHGKWIDAVIPNDNGDLLVQVCDQCNTFFPLAYTGGGHHFCPNCGADMRGEQDE